MIYSIWLLVVNVNVIQEVNISTTINVGCLIVITNLDVFYICFSVGLLANLRYISFLCLLSAENSHWPPKKKTAEDLTIYLWYDISVFPRIAGAHWSGFISKDKSVGVTFKGFATRITLCQCTFWCCNMSWCIAFYTTIHCQFDVKSEHWTFLFIFLSPTQPNPTSVFL